MLTEGRERDGKPPHVGRLARWRFLPLALAALAAVAFVAAHAPPRVKLLVLFPVFVGAASGGLAAALAMRDGLSRRGTLRAAAVLVPLALAGYWAESYRAWRSGRAAEVAANLLAQPGGKLVLDQVRSAETPSNAIEAEFLAAYRERMNPPVSVYLAQRLRGLPGNVPPPWPAVVAAVELLLGWAAGIAAAAVASSHQKETPDA